MSSDMKPEVSKSNQYYISKHRYYELRHYCCQYPEWVRKKNSLSFYPQQNLGSPSGDKAWQDRTASTAYDISVFSRNISLVEGAAKETDKDLWSYILRWVTEPGSYDTFNAREPIPMGREKYYALLRRFFYILDKWRD